MAAQKPQPRPEMKRRREELGLTQEEAAEQVGEGCTAHTWRNWERGIRGARVGTRPKIARILRVSLGEVAGWFGDAARPPDGVGVLPWLGHFASLEQGAGALWTWEPVTIPGLLQTAAYAAAIQRQGIGSPSDHQVDEFVRHRLARQRALVRDPTPLELAVVLDESALIRVTGDHTVMRAQLGHLESASQWPNIDVRVLPLDAGCHVAGHGSFTMFRSTGADDPHMVVIFDWGSAHYLERPDVVRSHATLFRHLQQLALSPAESTELIRDTKERFTP